MEKENWEDVHKDFNEYHQKEWKRVGFNKEQVKKWIKVGFQARDWREVEKWRKKYFTPLEIQTWIQIGLSKHDYKFASWLKKEGYQSEQVKNNLDSFRLLWWQEIHPDFTEECRLQWIKWLGWGDDERWAYKEAKKWISVGLTPSESQFSKWLKNKNYVPNEQEIKLINQIAFNSSPKEQLQNQYLTDEWAQFNPNFSCKSSLSDSSKTYQQRWKEYEFTKQQTQSWLEKGLKYYEYELAFYLKTKGKNPNSDLIKQIKEQGIKVQNYLEFWYPKEGTCLRKDEGYGGRINNYGKIRTEITELDISEKNLIGELVFTDWVNLELINLEDNRITALKIVNCPQLTRILASDNEIIDLQGLPISLVELGIYDNQLVDDLTLFSHLVNLKILLIGNDNENKINQGLYNRFTGSLAQLQKLVELQWLSISNTDINAGVEYLPIPIERIDHDTDLRSNCLLKEIEEELKEFKKDYGSFINKKLKETKQEKKEKELIVQKLEEKETFLRNRLEDYKPVLQDKLGEGGFALVYQGLWKGNSVAVKKSKFSTSQISEVELKDFEKEVNFLKKLNNPYIILYIDMFKDERDLMIITELAQYGSLTDYINNYKEKEYDWVTNYNFVRQMSSGLTYLHHSQIIHRDLKSMNILICEGMIAKIADFGLSKIVDNLTINKSSSKGFKGTIRWADPYLFVNPSPCYANDVYSLGMIIWEIVTKRIPYQNLDEFFVITQLLAKHKEEIPTDIPSVLKEIISGCWKDNPKERIKLSEIKDKIETTLKEEEAIIISIQDNQIETIILNPQLSVVEYETELNFLIEQLPK